MKGGERKMKWGREEKGRQGEREEREVSKKGERRGKGEREMGEGGKEESRGEREMGEERRNRETEEKGRMGDG